MTATVIPATVLSNLRRRRGLIEYRVRPCIICSRTFRTASPAQCACDRCRDRARAEMWEFGR